MRSRQIRGATRRRAAVGVAAVVIAMTALAGSVLAGHSETDVKSYTGCLTTNGGTLTLIREGASPAKPCPNGSTEAHFSGGDITGVTVGDGLTGGGTNGTVEIALDPQYSLRQDCASGDILEWNGAEWACAEDDDTTYSYGTGLTLSGTTFAIHPDYRVPNDQACTAGLFASGIDGDGDLTCATPTGASPTIWTKYDEHADVPDVSGGQDWTPVIGLNLPAGTFYVQASAMASDDGGGNGEFSIDCTLGATQAAVSSDDDTTAVLVIANILSGGGTVNLLCGSGGGSDHLNFVRIWAMKVGSVVTQ